MNTDIILLISVIEVSVMRVGSVILGWKPEDITMSKTYYSVVLCTISVNLS